MMFKKSNGLKNKFLVGTALLGVVFSSGFSYPNGAQAATQIKVGEVIIGTVRETTSIEEFIDSYVAAEGEKLSENVQVEPINFEVVMAKDEELSDENAIKEEIKKELDIYAEGYSIVVDGADIVQMGKLEDTEAVLNSIKETYIDHTEGIKVIEAGFKEEVEIVAKEITNKDIASPEKAKAVLTGAENEDTFYTTTHVDTLKNISETIGVPLNVLENANPNNKSIGIPAGSKIRIPANTANLTVVIKEEVVYKEPIAKEVVKVESDKYLKGQEVVEVPGSNGVVQYTAHTIKNNDVKVDNKIVERNVLQEPVTEVIAVGTSDRAATGTFINPTTGRLTSRFGPRWGRMHQGIDVAAPVGTPLHAADGGKVVSAGPKGTYGNFVEIDHENGYITRYAHLSSIGVKVGQVVKQGEYIGGMGSTGRSTGSHLHFEVLKDRKNQNPLNYVNY